MATIDASYMRDAVLNSTSLAYFVRIADLGSLTAAARELRVSQPSLSVAIRKLEEELDTTLLVRGRRGVTLTATGEALLRHARHALRTLDDARQEIHGLESEPRGDFVVGAHESLAAYCLPRFMASFLRTHPGIRLSLWNGNSREVERVVVEREVDIGLVVNPTQHPDSIVTTLFHDRVELIAAATLVRRVRKAGIGELLASQPLVYVPVLRQVQYILGALSKQGLAPSQHLPCSSMELVKSLVIDGVGIGILPYRVATHGVASGRLVAVSRELPSFDDSIALVRRFDMHQTAAARLLLDALREHGRSMPELPR
jgi:DNA-binding transcriptional LysR family regulator